MKERVSSLGVRQPWQLSTLLFTESRVVAWEILGLCDRQGSLARAESRLTKFIQTLSRLVNKLKTIGITSLF